MTNPTSTAQDRLAEPASVAVLPPPYYADDLVTLYNANCLDVLHLLTRS